MSRSSSPRKSRRSKTKASSSSRPPLPPGPAAVAEKVPPPPSKDFNVSTRNQEGGGGVVKTLGDGIAFGAGSAIGHRMMDRIFSTPTASPTKTPAVSESITTLSSSPGSSHTPAYGSCCNELLDNYLACMNAGESNCRTLYDKYWNCRETTSTFTYSNSSGSSPTV
jgi:hypothetical protein